MISAITGINWLSIGLIVITFLAIYYYFLEYNLIDTLRSLNLDSFNPLDIFKKKSDFFCKYPCANNQIPKVEWINTYGSNNPSKRLIELVAEFGAPDLIDPKKGGMALWDKSTLQRRGKCWERIEIIDEQIPHDVPTPHTDFLYGEYKLDIPNRMIDSVLNISKNISYDPLRKIITVRCHAMGPVKATALLAMYVATGRMSPQGAKAQYGDYVLATIPGSNKCDQMAESRYERELCEYYNLLINEGVAEAEAQATAEAETKAEAKKQLASDAPEAPLTPQAIKDIMRQADIDGGSATGKTGTREGKIEAFNNEFEQYANYPHA